MTPIIDIAIASPLWAQPARLRRLVATCIRETCALAQPKIRSGSEVSLLFCDDDQMRTLNRTWRNIDAATNVLSFPAAEFSRAAAKPCLGDIIVAHETVARESEAEAKPFNEHLCHLIVHGFLHLIGYDHVETEQAEVMEAMERAVLARLAIGDPYRSRLAETPG